MIQVSADTLQHHQQSYTLKQLNVQLVNMHMNYSCVPYPNTPPAPVFITTNGLVS